MSMDRWVEKQAVAQQNGTQNWKTNEQGYME